MDSSALVNFEYDEKCNWYYVTYCNGVSIGELSCAEDGYYVWWPSPEFRARGGFIHQEILKALADKLEELNKEWDTIVQNDPSISQTKGT